MPNYTIGLSGLNNNSNAIDTISNNIANASTVGYKAGEYIFEDQFYKAINPLDPARAGQGSSKQNIRRLFNMGTIQQSANTLDMAITGALGMFRLASNVDPQEVYYSRNGQFAVSKETDPNFPKRSYIVNENGMYLTGYTSQDGKNLEDQWTSRLTMPPTELEPKTTTLSTVAVNLDARTNTYLPSGKVPFNPDVPSSYNNRVSQTVYSADDNGGAHTMTLYYRRVDDQNLTITYDGANFMYPVSAMATNSLGANPENVVLTSDTSRSIELVSTANKETSVVVDDDTGTTPHTSTMVNVASSKDINAYARILVDGLEVDAAVASVSRTGGQAVIENSIPNVHTAQTKLMTFSGSPAAGDTLTVSVNGVDLEYSITAADIEDNTVLAQNLEVAFSASAYPAHTSVTATAEGNSIRFVANNPGDIFTLSLDDANFSGAADVSDLYGDNGQVDTVTVDSGSSLLNGASARITINGFESTYTNDSDETIDDIAVIAQGLVDAINSNDDVNTDVYAEIDGDGNIKITARNTDGTFTLSAESDGDVTFTETAVAPTAQIDTLTVSGNYAVGDVITVNINGVDLNYTVTALDIQAEGDSIEDWSRIAASIVSAFNSSLSPAHRGVTAATGIDGVVSFTADVSGDAFTVGSSVKGVGAVTLDTALTLKSGQKIEFFNPTTSVPAATSSPVGSATVNITANSQIQVGQYVYKLVPDLVNPDNPPKVTRVVDSQGKAITVDRISGSILTLSATPNEALSNDTLLFYNPVAYRLTLQDGSNVSMSGDLYSGQANQTFTASTTKYEVYGSLNGNFYNSGNNLFSGNVSLPDPIGDGAYKPIANLQFWGGKNIDSVVTNPVTGLPTFESQVTLSGKVTTPGNTPESLDPDLVFTLDLTGSRNFATPFGVDQSTQDGRSVALLNSVSIDKEGKIVGTYGDGRNFISGQLVLVNFAATNGLVPVGGNAFQASYMSGDEVNPNVLIGKPGNKGLGAIKAGAVEGSNVDLANELVKLLIQQRMYAANSQSIKAFDDTLTTTIRMAGG
jgi:flagellar hook-basal body protein